MLLLTSAADINISCTLTFYRYSQTLWFCSNLGIVNQLLISPLMVSTKRVFCVFRDQLKVWLKRFLVSLFFFRRNGRMEKLESGTRKRNPETEWYRTNKWEVWLTSIRLLPSLCVRPKMKDDIRSPFKKSYEYKEHSSYSFQLNDVLIIQSIFAFVCRSRQSGVLKGGRRFVWGLALFWCQAHPTWKSKSRHLSGWEGTPLHSPCIWHGMNVLR